MLVNNSFARKLHDAALGLVRWDAAFDTAFAFCIALVVLNGCGALPERERVPVQPRFGLLPLPQFLGVDGQTGIGSN